MTQHPLVVEPDIRAIHAQIEHVVQVLAAGDPRVEGEAPERLLVNGQATAAHMVRARQARAAHGLGDPLVEGAALLPEAVVPLVLPFREVGCLLYTSAAKPTEPSSGCMSAETAWAVPRRPTKYHHAPVAAVRCV